MLAALTLAGGSQPAARQPSPFTLPHRSQGGSPHAGIVRPATATIRPPATTSPATTAPTTSAASSTLPPSTTTAPPTTGPTTTAPTAATTAP